MLAGLAGIALLGFAATLVLIPFVASAAALHFTFALGVTPLILAAYAYFASVLTRSSGAGATVRTLPWVALAGAALLLFHLLFPAAFANLHHPGTLLVFAAVAGIGVWMHLRGRRAIGPPHPCLYWYVAAAACLALGLLALFAIPLWPQQYAALRRFHLHLNLLGFIGITAIGTLEVLLPTVLGSKDPTVAERLRRNLPAALGGSLLLAIGAGWSPAIAAAGGALWVAVIVRMLWTWLPLYRAGLFSWHGPAPSLGAAVAGFSIAILYGFFHAFGKASAAGAPYAFILLFLLPLVTGAATQLLPVWLRPGPLGEWHARFQVMAGRWSGVRALLFLAGGVGVMAGCRWGAWLSALALAMFAVQLLRAFVRSER